MLSNLSFYSVCVCVFLLVSLSFFLLVFNSLKTLVRLFYFPVFSRENKEETRKEWSWKVMKITLFLIQNY